MSYPSGKMSFHSLAPAFGLLALLIGAKPIDALCRTYHLGLVLSTLIAGIAAALFYWGTSKLLRFRSGRLGKWTPLYIGALCSTLVITQHLVEGWQRGNG
jgi:hypothetical protein